MPQLQNIVLTDRAAPPVNHTFVPRSKVADSGETVASTGVPLADRRCTVSMKKSSKGIFFPSVKIEVPIVENSIVNGVTIPVITRTGVCKIDFTFAPTSTEQERKDLVGLVQSCLDPTKVLVNDTVIKLQGLW